MKTTKSLILMALATCLASLSAQAKDWKTVRLGTDATYPPFESVDSNGQIVGFEVEYGYALCAKMHVTCTFQNQDWDGIIPSLLAGKFDVIFSGMHATPPRAKKVLFSDVYYDTPQVWVGQAANKSNDTSLEAVKGKLVGAQSSTAFVIYLDQYYKGIEVKLYPTGDESLVDLGNGRLDYALVDILVAQQFTDKNPGCCRILSEIPRTPEIFGLGAAAAFRPEDTDLASMFNKAIAEADADGTFKTIEAKYFKIDIRGKK
jgi:polar amino acid transport system substrate-binding protein